MKLLKASLLFVAFCAWLWGAAPARALEAEPLPPKLDASPVLVTSYQVADGKPVFVQLYNNSTAMVALDGWKLEYTAENGADKLTLPIALNGWLLPKEYAVFSLDGGVKGGDAPYQIDADLSLYTVTGLRLVPPAGSYLPEIVEERDGGEFTPGTWYQLGKTAAGNYTASRPFEPVVPDESGQWPPLYGGGLYTYDETTPLRIVEILANPKKCAPLEKSPNCREFIKLYNASGQTVDLSRYRLRFGYANDTPGVANTVHLAGLLARGAHHVIETRDDGKPLEITASGGSVWLEDAQGLKPVYEETVYDYPDIGDSDYKGFSWAVDETGKWRWAVASPGGANNFAIPAGLGSVKADARTPCRADQFRNPETGRCKKLASASSTKPCKPGQYRNPETNRCRSLATATAQKPCKPGQYRNSATNRCKSATAASAGLKPCKPGQERNPDTNRCRKKTSSIPGSAFAVEPLKETGKAFAGWWALGGVGVLAAGYGAWEWRQEVTTAMRRMLEFAIGRK